MTDLEQLDALDAVTEKKPSVIKIYQDFSHDGFWDKFVDFIDNRGATEFMSLDPRTKDSMEERDLNSCEVLSGDYEEKIVTGEAIKSTPENYAEAYCAKDIDALMRVFDDSDNISVIGTGADELCVGRSDVKKLFLRNFSEATANKFDWDWVDIRTSGNHAVIPVTFTLHLVYMEDQLSVPLRWTVVAKKETGRWVWIHRHASTAAAMQEEGEAYPKGNAN